MSRIHQNRQTARRGHLGLAALTLGTLAIIAGAGAGHGTSAQGSGPCAPPTSNPIVCENQIAGNPASEWDVSGAGDSSIQGFTTDISVNKGGTINFKVDTTAASIRLDIYRMGYYGGLGARKVTSLGPVAGQDQPACMSDAPTGLVDCGNWSQTTSWTVPSTAVSGIYFARAVRVDTGGASHIPFVVRDDTSNSAMLFQTSDTTWHAYNQYGGNSLYVGNPVGRAYKVSYNRPITTRGTGEQDSVFNAEYPMVRWLESNGYNVSYTSGVDTDRRGAELLEHKIFLSVGHDEYWSGAQRTNVEAARAAGVNLAFFSGNEVFWKTRWENSISGGSTPYRTLVTYKETHANAKIDPAGVNVWTGTWRDPRFSPPGDGNRPENALTGTIFYVNAGTSGIRVPAAEGKMRFWRFTDVANLPANGFFDLPYGTLGYEWDEDRDNGFRPAGLIRMSDTTVSGVDYLQDYGSNYSSGTANHALTLYRHASGALVFGAGTVQWSWGLDSNHDRGSEDPEPAMQQATLNLFADMGVQPVTPQSNLVVATASTDSVAPTTTITSPTTGAGVPANAFITITGTAADTGGVVGGVEVSVDGGASWRKANGRENWTYVWATGSPRTVNIRARAVDDSVNLGTGGTGISVTVGVGTVACPCSIWNPVQSPSVPAEPDPSSVEIGTRFRSNTAGYITGIRFYKGAQNTGAHVGNLWTDGGTLLSSVTFVGESASGWQEALLPSPVQITADTTYVVSYHTNTGYYAGDDNYFATQGVQNGPLYAPRDGEYGSNGVYRYGASAFPNQTYGSESYWVDVVFVTSVGADTIAPTISSVTPSAGSSGAAANTTVTALFSENVNSGTVTTTNFELRTSTNVLVPATVSYSAGSRTATLTPSSALAFSATYTARVRGGSTGVKDPAGNALAADYVWTFTTGAAPPPPPTEGPGGPILVVSSTSNPFSRYFAEILRAEGLNSFAAMDISAVTTSVLSAYDVVILGNIPLTSTQVSMFTTWVNSGGNLVAMRPDKQLASLLGLSDAGSTLAEGYMLVNTGAAPGAGIVGQTMQYHGTADRYTLNGATQVAALYSNATTATTNPAVTVRSVGASGGQAAAFTFDLARSIVYTRQGNPAWSGQERDGVAPIRSDDFFFGGGSSPDWINLDKVAIPQADEQQRLLANLIAFVNADRKLLPKFWYFPRGEKAAIVMTGDDHATNGTTTRFNIYKANSPAGCNVANWECVRGTSYIYPHTPISNAQVAAFINDGFEIGVHVSTGCGDYTPDSLPGIFEADITQFFSNFPSVSALRSNRTHCIAFSDYDTQPQVELANGIRVDTNYYYWPGSWVLNRPGFMTGSGMAMRFAKLDGSMIDVFQAATQMTDESDQTWPFTVNSLLDKALGPEGYYGFFVANMHTDGDPHAGSEAIVASALARSVPVISAQQLLTWVDGRNASSFSGISWNGSTLAFSIAVGTGANGLEAMVPSTSGSSTIVAVTRAGSPVSYRVETIKGVGYAIFSATAGAYSVSYGTDTTAPVITGVTATPSNTSATIAWTTNEAANSRVDYGTSATSLTLNTTIAALSIGHSVELTGLAPATTYYYRVRSADNAGNATTSPVAASPAASFTTTSAPSLNCPCSIWPPTAVPAVPSVVDTGAVEVGVKFRPSANGYITALRFYKGPQNVGTHLGNLWTAAGVPLASAVFTGESASGWQQVTLNAPVPVTAGTVYVASYHTTSGYYSADGGYFSTSGVTNGPLEALATGVSGGNGAYIYGGSAFPTQTFNGANYWVDVVFETQIGADTTPPSVTVMTPTANATGVAINSSVTATFNEAMTAGTISTTSFDLRTATNVVVPATVTYDVPTRTATLVPATPLANSTAYTATVRGGAAGVKDAIGNAPTSDFSWTFTTVNLPVFTLVDATATDFGSGAPGSATYIGQSADGEVLLTPTAGAEFGGAALPVGWTGESWGTAGVITVAGGALSVDGARVHTDAFYSAGQSLEFVGTFSNDGFEHAGFGVTLNETPWAIFSTGTGGSLYARTHNGTTPTDTALPGSWLNTPHRYRIDWAATTVTYSIDGTVVATHNVAIPGTLRPIVSNYPDGSGVMRIDWFRLTPYAPTGTFTSRVLDGGSMRQWASAAWTADVPAGTTLTVSARFGNTAVPDGTWTAFTTLTSGGALTQSSRYVQYQVSFTSSTLANTPEFRDITFTAGTPAVIPAISVADVSLTEGNSGTSTAVFNVVLSAATTQTVTVAYSTANGTATAGSDYGTVGNTLTFPPGATTLPVSVTVTGDTQVETDETFFLNLSSPTNATISDNQATGTILNEDIAPLMSIADVSVSESAGTATFTVTLSAPTPNVVSATYATANGTAVAGQDFTATTNTVSFPANTTSRTFTVAITNDTADEDNETFLVNLSSPSANVLIGDGQALATITDNDNPPNISIADRTVAEGTAAGFTVTLAAASGKTITVNYATAAGTAVSGTDFTATSGLLTFAPGVTTQTVTVPTTNDTLSEATESFTVVLTSPVNSQFGDASATGSITDNDTLPTVRIDDLSTNEPTGTTGTATLTVTLSTASGQNVVVPYSTGGGTAVTSGTTPDYNAANTSVTIPAGSLTASVNITLRGDNLDEDNETFNVTLGTPTGATILDGIGVVTIVDNDTASVSINNVTSTEGLLLPKNFNFTVTLSNPSTRAITVTFSTANGTATAGSDYTARTNATLTIAAGSTTGTIAIVVQGDFTNEPTETFFVNLLSATGGAVIGDNQGLGTITNDD